MGHPDYDGPPDEEVGADVLVEDLLSQLARAGRHVDSLQAQLDRTREKAQQTRVRLLTRLEKAKRKCSSVSAQLDATREAFAQVAMKLLLNDEPTVGELREQLVKAGIDGPDRLSELASPPTEKER